MSWKSAIMDAVKSEPFDSWWKGGSNFFFFFCIHTKNGKLYQQLNEIICHQPSPNVKLVAHNITNKPEINSNIILPKM